MNMIQKIRDNKRNYFFSVNENGKITIGGYDGGRNYGLIEISVSVGSATIERTVSDGVSSSMVLLPQSYTPPTLEYKEILSLKKEIEIYLRNAENLAYMDENRERLLLNTMELLPAHRL